MNRKYTLPETNIFNSSTWKSMVGRCISFLGRLGLFSASMSNFGGGVSGCFVPPLKHPRGFGTEHPRWNSPHVSRSNIKAHWPLEITAETQAALSLPKICRFINKSILSIQTYLNMYTYICLYMCSVNIHVYIYILYKMGPYNRYKWSYGVPVNGRKQMGNWVVFIPINGVMGPYL